MRKKSKGYKVKGRIWLTVEGVSLLGEGKIELIENVVEFGSLSKAAEAMKMSYRKAWSSIKKINEMAEEQVMILKRGGTGGGESMLTDYGKKLLKDYKKVNMNFTAFLEEQNEILGKGS